MKVLCDRPALVDALNLVTPVVLGRTPKPVLLCVKLTAQDDTLTLTATDLEIGVRVSTARVEVREAGETLVPAGKFSEIVRESIDPTLTLETEGEATHIRGQDSHFKVLGYNPGDFPAVASFTGEADFEIGAGELSLLIQQTLYATARENSRYAINGVLIEREGGKLSVVATDGHRLALAKGECRSAKGDNRSAIVPTKALTMLSRLLSESEQGVRVKIDNSQILFAADNSVLTSNLVEGNFPPYKDVIPRDGDKRATLATDVLISGIRRAALLTNEESKGVRFAFGPEGLTLSSRAAEMGEAEVKVDLPRYEGDPIEIGFNPFYLLDALKVANAQEVQLDMRAGNKPGVLKAGGNFQYVVMPVNLA